MYESKNKKFVFLVLRNSSLRRLSSMLKLFGQSESRNSNSTWRSYRSSYRIALKLR